MSRYYDDWPRYVPVAERRRRAKAKINRMVKKGRAVSPVEISGTKIATTFWGKAWCDNLESYSDFSNRLPRGRTYVRNGSVMDLQIEPGVITSLVAGSSLYTAKIKITHMTATRWKDLVKECAGGVDSLVELLQGRLSRGVMELICRKKSGLFPAPQQISMSCSCPDWATMCKHVAATLYGVGARLDEQPELLFRLRQVDEADLIERAGETTLAESEPSAGFQTLESDDLSTLFGIDLEEGPTILDATPASRQKTRRKTGSTVRGKRGGADKRAAGTKRQRIKKTPQDPGGRITARELTARGIPHPRIQSWLRSGVLRHSGERGVYLPTAATTARIDEYLATKKVPAVSRSRGAKAARASRPRKSKRVTTRLAKTRPARSARSEKPAGVTGGRRGKVKSKTPTRTAAAPRSPQTHVTARELTAAGIPHSTIQSWIRSGVILRTGQRGVYCRTSATAKKIHEYIEKRWPIRQ